MWVLICLKYYKCEGIVILIVHCSHLLHGKRGRGWGGEKIKLRTVCWIFLKLLYQFNCPTNKKSLFRFIKWELLRILRSFPPLLEFHKMIYSLENFHSAVKNMNKKYKKYKKFNKKIIKNKNKIVSEWKELELMD